MAIWRDALSAKLKELASGYQELYIPATVQPASLTGKEIASIFSVEPFPRHRWNELLMECPVVTFMWRTDRVWTKGSIIEKMLNHACGNSRIVAKVRRIIQPSVASSQLKNQLAYVKTLAQLLKSIMPNLDFAVCGLGKTGKLPDSIQDLRFDVVDESVNRLWLDRASRSHILLAFLALTWSCPVPSQAQSLSWCPMDFSSKF